MITMKPPEYAAVFRRIMLSSGNVVRPIFRDDDAIALVDAEADAVELEAEGWTRVPQREPRS